MRTQRTQQVTARDTQRTRLIRAGYSPARERCESCGRASHMLSLAEAAAFARAGAADVEARLRSGELHAGASDGARVRVCLDSLLAASAGAAAGPPDTSEGGRDTEG